MEMDSAMEDRGRRERRGPVGFWGGLTVAGLGTGPPEAATCQAEGTLWAPLSDPWHVSFRMRGRYARVGGTCALHCTPYGHGGEWPTIISRYS